MRSNATTLFSRGGERTVRKRRRRDEVGGSCDGRKLECDAERQEDFVDLVVLAGFGIRGAIWYDVSIPTQVFSMHFIMALLIVVGLTCSASEEPPQLRSLEQDFERSVRPFLDTSCLGCHGKTKQEAKLDLSPFTNVAARER